MADVNRFRHADPKRVRMFPVDSATVIEVGDNVWQSVDAVEPASDFTYVTSSLADTQANFRRDYVGVAMDASAAGDTDSIAVATAGTFLFPCASSTFEIGDQVGPDDNAGGDELVDQQVIAIGESGYGSIGMVSKRYGSATTSVEIEITPQMFKPVDQQVISMGYMDITTAADILTDLDIDFPFTLVRYDCVQITDADADMVITVHNGANAIDDTVTVTNAGAVGSVQSTAVDDSNDYHHFAAGGSLSIVSDGAGAAGEIFVNLFIKPFMHERG